MTSEPTHDPLRCETDRGGFRGVVCWLVSPRSRPRPVCWPPFGSRLTRPGTTRQLPCATMPWSSSAWTINILGRLVSEVAPPVEFPISRDIVPVAGYSLATCREFPGRSRGGLRFAPTAAGPRSTWSKRNVPGLPSVSAASPGLSTGGKSAAAWQAGDLVYVLVVEGDPAVTPAISISRTDR